MISLATTIWSLMLPMQFFCHLFIAFAVPYSLMCLFLIALLSASGFVQAWVTMSENPAMWIQYFVNRNPWNFGASVFPCKIIGQWLEILDASSCRCEVGNHSSHVMEQNTLSILVIIGLTCWLVQVNFLPCRLNSFRVRCSMACLKCPINLLFSRLLLLSSTLYIRLKSPTSSHLSWTLFCSPCSSSINSSFLRLPCGPYTVVRYHSLLAPTFEFLLLMC